MLRGNHETQSINQHYGFHRELTEKYGSQKLYEAFQVRFGVFRSPLFKTQSCFKVVLDGIEFFAGDINSGLITVFSAPHYCGM